MWSDVRIATRALKRSPGFSASAIVTIALGVGVNTGMFTILNGVLFRGLPAPDAHELVSIYQKLEGVPDREGAYLLGLFSSAEYRTYRDRSQTLSGVIGHSDPTRTTLGGESPQEILGAIVSCNYFDVLRQRPTIGRGLAARDCETGADPVVVLGYELWTTTFSADRRIVGRTVELNRQLFTVVGVAAEGTYGGFIYATGYFAPLSAQPLLLPTENAYQNDRDSWLFVLGRRNDGASLAQVRAELGVIAAQIDQQEPGRSTTLRIERATPLSIPGFRVVALAAGSVVMIAFALVLLIACANLANLLLARATTRGREIALRLSLGAGRARIIRQLLVESVLISIAGGALGSILAIWSFRALIAFALPAFSPVGIPTLLLDSSPDIRVLLFMLALTFGTGVLFGLAPALHASKPDLYRVMKQDASGIDHRGGRLRGALVGIQVALCMVLMIATGLLARGLSATQTIDPGFAYRDVAVVSFGLESAGYSPEETSQFAQQLLEGARSLPGVEAVGYGIEPLSADREAGRARLPEEDPTRSRLTQLNWVTPGYFSVVGIPIVRGRNFTEAELGSNALVAIVSETTARNFWPGVDPIGQALMAGPELEFRVVGVAKDAEVTNVGETDAYYLYLPPSPRVQRLLKLLVKSRADFGATAASIRAAVQALDPGLWVRVSPLAANLEWARNLSGFVTTLAASLGALALVLAAVGIYGVVSYFVSRRFREIGIRMALGATASSVLGLILRRTMQPVVVGAAIGIAAAAAASSALSSMLFGVSPVDPVGLGGAAVLVLCIALAAGLLAGRRGTRVDPMVTLRY